LNINGSPDSDEETSQIESLSRRGSHRRRKSYLEKLYDNDSDEESCITQIDCCENKILLRRSRVGSRRGSKRRSKKKDKPYPTQG